MIEISNDLTINRQCDLLGVPRSSYYYSPIPESKENLLLMREIDLLYLEHPSYGSRLMAACLNRKGFGVNRKRISRLMKIMGIETIYPKPKIKTSQPGTLKFPYLLKDYNITGPNQAWGTDITYISMENGFMYLVVFLDLYSRYVLSWSLSNSLESGFCIEALNKALEGGKALIYNSDQGVQYTSYDYVNLIKSIGGQISMSGKGRCWDNIFVERFWRSIKYEEILLNQYNNFENAFNNIEKYIVHFNNERPHSALNYKTPKEVHFGF